MNGPGAFGDFLTHQHVPYIPKDQDRQICQKKKNPEQKENKAKMFGEGLEDDLIWYNSNRLLHAIALGISVSTIQFLFLP